MIEQHGQGEEREWPADLESALNEAIRPLPMDAADRLAVRKRLLKRVRMDKDWLRTRTVHFAEGRWEPLLPKVQIKVLRRDETSMSYLLQLEPGGVIPPHFHPMEEECVVLQGELTIGDLVVGAGDYHVAPKDMLHVPIRARTRSILFLRGAAHGHPA